MRPPLVFGLQMAFPSTLQKVFPDLLLRGTKGRSIERTNWKTFCSGLGEFNLV